ncbi:PREDICTED: uncharacterized protein LOC109467333 [Branchiostoma belcheri]|uniref:Uncharacterized protein LOC109467333 n=1 Tax=Branchiostoma belcheri TaxID=7741 RepID=A0A6P4Y8P0_BRABE|nr:PREDICTED: uncharacterized protein LOC109467333 [Branchiostoma belcheri]
MFNNSSDSWLSTEKALAPEMSNLLSCYRWYLQNKTVSNAQASEACSKYEDLVRLGTGTDIVFWLMGLLIIITNAAVVWGIVATRELSRTVSFLLANLATTDLFAGVALLYRTVGHLVHDVKFRVILTFVNLMTLTQLLSASALSLLSVNSYVAIRHPIFFRSHSGNADRYVGVVLACTWVSFTLLTISPNMGWNCIDMHILTTGTCVSYYPVAIVIICASILLFLCGIMLFTNISTFIAIKKRSIKRLGRLVEARPQTVEVDSLGKSRETVVNHRRNVAQDEERRKLERTVHRTTEIISKMFNNSSDSWFSTEKALAPEMSNLLSCYRWYLQNKTVSNAQANEACSKYEDLVGLGTGTDIIFWLMGPLIIITNAVVLWGIIATRELNEERRKLERTVHRARTVMLHVVVAFVFWLLSCILVAICRIGPGMCPGRNGAFACICANSFISPMATLVRTPNLRQAIWEKLMLP